MRNPFKRKFNPHSVLIKFFLVFLLFGSLLGLVAVAVQNDLAQSTAEKLNAGQSVEEVILNTKNAALNSSLAIAVIILYTFVALFLFVVRWNRSLKRMEGYLTEIGSGNFPAAPLKISGGDEMSEMADVINEMKDSLVERERLRSELELARTIQAEMLPGEDAARSLPESCRVQGFMVPAKEVGGDLYDFFMIDENRLALVIADVSDKGVPAALFMATAKMCIKDNLMLGADPGEVLNRVNNRLLENNRSGLFVTAWVGMLDLQSGRLKYADAGHPYPFIRRGEKPEYEELKSDRNLVLAGFPDFTYRQEETFLQPGDRIFLYTDGLDEARDKEGNFFGKQRIKLFLDRHISSETDGIIPEIRRAVELFAAGREQYDDLTLLLAEYAGGAPHE